MGLEPLMTNVIVRTPTLKDASVVRLVNGPEAFTPDGEFILGPSEARGFWIAAGFCAHGLAGAGGMGRLVAAWIANRRPEPATGGVGSRPLRRPDTTREYARAGPPTG